MILTDEQRKVWLNYIAWAKTTGSNHVTVDITALESLLSSEQAWREEVQILNKDAEDTANRLINQGNRMVDLQTQLNQAVEMLQGFIVWEEMFPSVKTYNKTHPALVDDDYEQYRAIVANSKEFISSLLKEEA